jgi:hypothetical protein
VTDQPVQTETSDDNFIPPGATSNSMVADHAVLQVTKLAGFLVENFPDEVALTNRQVPETPVDTAIRLLLSWSAKSPAIVRCQVDYCNKAVNHQGEHGWVQAD